MNRYNQLAAAPSGTSKSSGEMDNSPPAEWSFTPSAMVLQLQGEYKNRQFLADGPGDVLYEFCHLRKVGWHSSRSTPSRESILATFVHEQCEPYRHAFLVVVARMPRIKRYRVRLGDMFDNYPPSQEGNTDIHKTYAYYALMLLRFSTVSPDDGAEPRFKQEPDLEAVTDTHRYGYHGDDWFCALWAILAFQNCRLENKHILLHTRISYQHLPSF
ncbi:hypothetical protein DL768_004642 [Monosporascus sp. mg162]|nr:hypothetical protein DL768_004642 [Monosporascus sp. mg162]